MGGIMPRRASDAAARMGARSAHIESPDRPAIIAMSEHRPRRPELVEAHMSMEDVAADQAELALQVERRVDLPRDHARLKLGAWSLTVSMMRSATCSRTSSHDLPSGSAGANCWQNRLATCAPAGARLSVHRSRAALHLDDRLLRPAMCLRVLERLIHIVEARRDDDAGGVMLCLVLAPQHREIGQLRERDIHAECARAGLVALDALVEVGGKVGAIDHLP